MPTYVFNHCGKDVEEWRWKPDEPPPVCALCGKPMDLAIGGGNPPLFKGAGFASTQDRGGADIHSGARRVDKFADQVQRRVDMSREDAKAARKTHG